MWQFLTRPGNIGAGPIPAGSFEFKGMLKIVPSANVLLPLDSEEDILQHMDSTIFDIGWGHTPGGALTIPTGVTSVNITAMFARVGNGGDWSDLDFRVNGTQVLQQFLDDQFRSYHNFDFHLEVTAGDVITFFARLQDDDDMDATYTFFSIAGYG